MRPPFYATCGHAAVCMMVHVPSIIPLCVPRNVRSCNISCCLYVSPNSSCHSVPKGKTLKWNSKTIAIESVITVTSIEQIIHLHGRHIMQHNDIAIFLDSLGLYDDPQFTAC